MKLLTSTQSMSLNDIECPWPADGADLSLADLNEIEKTWLVHQVVAKLQITKKLAELYHLKPDTLRSFAHLSAEKKKFICRSFPAIDQTGIREVRQKFKDGPHITKADIDSEIDSKLLPTARRFFNDRLRQFVVGLS